MQSAASNDSHDREHGFEQIFDVLGDYFDPFDDENEDGDMENGDDEEVDIADAFSLENELMQYVISSASRSGDSSDNG